jgi:hypothetical protein
LIPAGAAAFGIPFALAALAVFPGLFDSTMMSRLAVYPALGAALLTAGRSFIGRNHLAAGALMALVPMAWLFVSGSPLPGIPQAVRWAAFGMMAAGFGGTVARWGFGNHLRGLAWAAALMSLHMAVFGPDALSGNPNRAGMILALGMVASAAEKKRVMALVQAGLILPGLAVSGFYASWLAAALGLLVLAAGRRWSPRPGLIIAFMLAGQTAFCLLPEHLRMNFPTLGLRSAIWRTSGSMFLETFPWGTGTGRARLSVYTRGGEELQSLAGPEKRVDFLHSEPLELLTGSGIAGAAMLALFFGWISGSRRDPLSAALLCCFWVIFTGDLPLATPLGALPAALVLGGCLAPGGRIRIPLAAPLVLLGGSLFWGVTVTAGYRAMATGRGNPEEASRACRLIPFEERAWLQAGWEWLGSGHPLESSRYSAGFIGLYPSYHGGWELEASVRGALGRDDEAVSAWRRAFMLAPGGQVNRLLYALNGAPGSAGSGDTLRAMGETLARDVPWTRLFPGTSLESYPEIARRILILAENLCASDPRLAGELFSRAVITAHSAPDPGRALFMGDAVLLYREYSALIPEIYRNKVETFIGLR